MRIGINCRSFLKEKYTGIGRYAYHLVKSLVQADTKNNYSLYANINFFDFKRKAPAVKAKNFSVKIDRFDRGPKKTIGAVDVYHLPSPELSMDFGVKTVVTVHDLVYKTYPEGHPDGAREISEKQLAATAKNADRIICVSQSTKDDFKRFFSVDERKLSVIYHGVDENIFSPLREGESARASWVVRSLGIQKPFLLFVGTIEPRKNLKNLLEAFSLLKKRGSFGGVLVVAGMKGWMVEGLEALTAKLGIIQEVIFLGWVEDEGLRYMYALAEIFIYPSFYEGFGFPILEAFHCGAAVVTSDVSSCPEIAKDAALLVDPRDPQKIAGAIEKILGDKNLKKTLKEKALSRAKDFSFLKTARETLGVYQAA